MKLILVLIISLSFLIQVKAESSLTVKKLVDQKTDTLNVKLDSTATDSINISQLVQMQVDAARKKAVEEKNNPYIKVDMKNAELNTGSIPMLEKTDDNIFIKIKRLLRVPDDVFLKGSIIFAFSTIMLGTVFIKRKISSRKNKNSTLALHSSKQNKKSKSLKDNISLLREERPIKSGKKNKNKLLIRTKLVENAPARISQEAAARSAKELQISHGEILLASRLKSHGFEK